MVRLHGRDRAAWLRRDLATAADRFAYLYSDAELQSFVAPVAELASHAGEVHVLFNNCHRDWAQTNAARFGELLRAEATHQMPGGWPPTWPLLTGPGMRAHAPRE